MFSNIKNEQNNKLENLKPTSYKKTLNWWNYVRWFSTVSFLSVGLIQLTLSGSKFPIHAFLLILIAIILLNIAYTFWLEIYNTNLIYPMLHNLLDIIIFSFAIFMTGGIHSPFLWGYLIPILTSSITIGLKAGFFASVLSIFGLFVASYLSDSAITLTLKETYETIGISTIETKTILSYGSLFFLVYFISSFLANTLRLQNSDLANVNQQLEIKNKLILESQKKLIEMKRREAIYQTIFTLQHELNNPLAIASLQAEMLLKENETNRNSRLSSMSEAIYRIKKIMEKIKKLNSDSIPMRDALDGVKIFDIDDSVEKVPSRRFIK